MPSADFWQAIRDSHEPLSPDFGTPARPPGVSSPAFGARPLDLQPEPLMDMGLSVICPLARLGMPRIQFLFVGSRLCSALLSDTLSRDRCPCVSLRLHLHQVGEGTCTPKLVNMPSTQKRARRNGGPLPWVSRQIVQYTRRCSLNRRAAARTPVDPCWWNRRTWRPCPHPRQVVS